MYVCMQRASVTWAGLTHRALEQAVGFAYANAEGWCLCLSGCIRLLSSVGPMMDQGSLSMDDMRAVILGMYHVAETVQMLECGEFKGAQRQFWDAASQVRLRMMDQLRAPRKWAAFNPIFVRCMHNAVGQIVAAMRMLRDRQCPCLCVPAVLFARACLDGGCMREEERVLRRALARLHAGAEDLEVMSCSSSAGHEWAHWWAVSHMVVEAIRSREEGGVPPTMKPFEKRLQRLSAEFARYSAAAARVEVGMRCADPSLVCSMRSEDFMALAAAGEDSEELQRLCRGLKLADAMNSNVVQQAEESLAMAWSRCVLFVTLFVHRCL